MTTEVENQPQAEAAEASLSFLDRAIEATTQTPAVTAARAIQVSDEPGTLLAMAFASFWRFVSCSST